MRQRTPPLVDGTVSRFFCVTLLSQDQPLLDRGACRSQASGDSTGGRAWSRMTTTSVRARCVGRPSSSAEWCTVSVSSVQHTICQDTFHDASFCHTPHVNFSGSSDPVPGVRFCHHLHSALSSDRVRGACTCCHLRSGFLGDRLRESQ